MKNDTKKVITYTAIGGAIGGASAIQKVASCFFPPVWIVQEAIIGGFLAKAYKASTPAIVAATIAGAGIGAIETIVAPVLIPLVLAQATVAPILGATIGAYMAKNNKD